MRFDDFYDTIGSFGLYQKIKYFLLCCTNLLPPVMVYAWTFIAATPEFRCKPSIDDLTPTNFTYELSKVYMPSAAQCRESQKTISLKECQRCFQIVNTSYDDNMVSELARCTSFDFSRTFYQSTIVEEVS